MVFVYILLAVLTAAIVFYLKPSSGGQMVPATDITVTARAPFSNKSCSSTATGRHRTSRRAQREKSLKERSSQKEENEHAQREKKLAVPVCPIVEPSTPVQPMDVPSTPPHSFEETVIVQSVVPTPEPTPIVIPAPEVCAQSVNPVVCDSESIMPPAQPVAPLVIPVPEVSVQPDPAIYPLPTASPEENVATARPIVDTETQEVKTAKQVGEIENPSVSVSMTSTAPEEKKKNKKKSKKKTTSKLESKKEKKKSKKKRSVDGKTSEGTSTDGKTK